MSRSLDATGYTRLLPDISGLIVPTQPATRQVGRAQYGGRMTMKCSYTSCSRSWRGDAIKFRMARGFVQQGKKNVYKRTCYWPLICDV